MENQPLHKRVWVAYGIPREVEAWSYPTKKTREIHVAITTRQGEDIQVVIVVPR